MFDWLFPVLTIAAIIIGPIAAVQTTRYMDNRAEARARRLWVFKTLMATRAATLSSDHVNALNSVNLEFRGNSASDKEVMAAWHTYLAALNLNVPAREWAAGAEHRRDLFGDLLQKMARAVGYNFDIAAIKNDVYYPQGYTDAEIDQLEIRRGLKELLAGKRSIPLYEGEHLRASDSIPPKQRPPQ